MSLQSRSSDQTVTGIYKWVLVFDYDNSGNKETISRTMEYSTTKKVISRSLIENKFHVGAEYEYKGELSAKLSLKKIGEVSSKIESRVHIDTANDLVTSCEENKEIDETFTDSQVYKIAGGSRLTLYQLCYDMDGASCKTGVLVSTPGTAPGPEVKVDVTFTCTTSILGFTDILDRLFNTHPGSQNTAEWASIRQCITQNRDGTAEDAFYALVNTLNNIRPLSANTAEWTNIRAACTQILRDWKHTDKTLLLKVLLSQFADTFPSHDNRDEWEAIRNTSNAILGALKAVWAEPESIAA